MRNLPWFKKAWSRQGMQTRSSLQQRLVLEALEDRSLPSGTTFAPVAAASIHDEPRDGQGDSFDLRFDDIMSQNSAREDRAIVEFNLASVASEPVNLAVLDFLLAVNSQGTPVRTFDVYVYTGNGQRDLADFSAPGTKVATVSFFGAEGGKNCRLDVTSAVQDLLAGGNTIVGVRVDAVNDVTPTHFLHAKLTINGAPAPIGLRGWESVPNAILMDGVDEFHVEVDVGGAVNSVTLDPFSIYLVPPSDGTVSLRDDGLGGDRVAGDFIYTSGPFHYNTARTFPSDFYEGDPNSPAGIHVEDVGDIFVEELDGVVSQFLLRPAVGLVRADIPLASSVDVTGNIVATDHLINIRTDGRATQRTLRGPADTMYQVTKPIYEQFRDAIDFFMFFSTNKMEQLPRLSSGNFHAGVHLDAKVEYTGTGRPLMNNTAFYGSGGRLQGLNLLDAYSRGIWGFNATHELVHQWSAYIDPSMGVTEFGGHYNGRSSAGSLVGGLQWTANGDGSYTINFDEGQNGATHASDIDLYMMGLIDESEVEPILAYSGPGFKNPDNPIVQAGEIAKTVTIDDIIGRHGARTPGPATAQRDFKLAFVAESHNRLLTPVELTFYEIFAAHYTKPIPDGQPDPRADAGWTSIARFFGHGTTWSSDAPQLRGLTVDIQEVSPDPRATAVNQISIVFSDAASGFDLSDLTLTRDGGANLLTGSETLSSADNKTWMLSGLAGLTAALGSYQLTLTAAGSGIQGPDGKPLVAGDAEAWSKIAPKVNLSIDAANIAEDSGAASVTATLSHVTDVDVVVDLEFGGTAANDVDYTRSAIQLTIPAGQTQASMTLSAIQDALDENDETVIVDIVSVTNALEDGTQQGTVTVVDDDPLPSLAIGDANAVLEGAAGAEPELEFVVQLSAANGRSVTVGYATAAASATPDVDYVPGSGTLTFEPGETSKTIRVKVIGDDFNEVDETFSVVLSDPSNATLSDDQGVGAILNDDPLPAVSIGNATAVVEGGPGARPELEFVVQLSAASGRTVTVNYATSPATATSDVDYVAASGTVTFAPGQTSQVVRVQVIGDSAIENNETLDVVLSNPQNATLAAGRGTGTILNDDKPAIDIKPGDATNRINISRESTIRVAILSAVGFDARTAVVVNSLRFGRTGAEDSLVRSNKGVPKTEIVDVNGDGRLDLVAYFTTAKTGLRVGDTQAILSGTLTNGVSFSTAALIEIIATGGKGNGKGG